MVSSRVLHLACWKRMQGHTAHREGGVLPAQALELGAAAVADQCREIEAWTGRLGKAKRGGEAPSTAALEAQIEALCSADLEAAYRHSAGGMHEVLRFICRSSPTAYPRQLQAEAAHRHMHLTRQ